MGSPFLVCIHHEAAQPFADLISNSPERVKLLGLRAVNRGRVLEAPVNSIGSAWKHGAVLLRVVADCDDLIEWLRREFIDRLGPVARYINSYLAHRFDRLGANTRGRGPGALDFKPVARDIAEDSLSHLASR
jgi:hypothetical protein